MVTIPPLLSFKLLDMLESRWRASGWPGVEWLAPGLTEHEIDALTQPLGVRLPDEVRTWWRWHDGISPPTGASHNEAAFGAAGREFLSMTGAVRQYTLMRDVAAKVAEGETLASQENWWPRQLFPVTVTNGGMVTACDCSVRPATASPVHTVDFHDGPAGPQRAASLGTVVSWWIMAIDTGAWYYDADERQWNYDWELAEQSRNIGDAI